MRPTPEYEAVRALLGNLEINTVCQHASCPNIWECWGKHQTATFMILGDTCTRSCRYCDVPSGRPKAPRVDEPEAVAKAAALMKLRHVVVTSVDRDDLPDFGASHWAATVRAIYKACGDDCNVEVLTPDFGGIEAHIDRVVGASPVVYGHNIETVPRLFPKLRARGDYQRSLLVLEHLHHRRQQQDCNFSTKTGLMLGLGERTDEVLEVMNDLRRVGCDLLTLGQYLNPTSKHAPVERFYSPDEFDKLRCEGLARGFQHVESGPLVRSSYHAASYHGEGQQV